MAKSIYQIKKNQDLREKAVKLYKEGMTLREVGKVIGRSRTWVWKTVHELIDEPFIVSNKDVDNHIDKV